MSENLADFEYLINLASTALAEFKPESEDRDTIDRAVDRDVNSDANNDYWSDCDYVPKISRSKSKGINKVVNKSKTRRNFNACLIHRRKHQKCPMDCPNRVDKFFYNFNGMRTHQIIIQ